MPVFNVNNSTLSTFTQAQQDNLILMVDTDVRSILQSLEAIKATQVKQATQDSDTRLLLSKVRNSTTLDKQIVISKTSFVLTDAIWMAQCVHDLDDLRPVVSIYDATGDQQLIQFVAKTNTSGVVELTQAQYDGNAFPLTVALSGRASGAYVYKSNDYGSMPGWNAKFNLYYGYLNRFGNPGFEGNYQQNPQVSQAFLTPYDFFVYTHQNDDFFGKIDSRDALSSYITITRQEYETKRIQPGVIFL